MTKIFCLAVGLFLVTVCFVSAEIYKCRTPAGNLVMTDDETVLPAGCEPVKGVAEKGSFNSVPSLQDEEVVQPDPLPESKAAPNVKDASVWQGEADKLVKSYKDAVRRRYRATLEIDRLRAVQELPGLREKKQKMLDALSGSDLRRDQQNVIRKTLDAIP